jgi:hypothetical protein
MLKVINLSPFTKNWEKPNHGFLNGSSDIGLEMGIGIAIFPGLPFFNLIRPPQTPVN